MGDGLDTIDTSAELYEMLNHPVARFTVVRAINYGSGPGNNTIGCGWIGGWGIAGVRYGSTKTPRASCGCTSAVTTRG